jgi:ribulose 1,5-bisphosphate synthetase/thiazole synthase
MNKPNYTRRDLLKTIGAGAAAAALPIPTDQNTAEQKKQAAGGDNARKTDVLVCGGGPAGVAAAIMAARQKAKVLLIERYGRLGGMAVQARVSPLMGNVKSDFVDEVLKHIGGRKPNLEQLDIQYAAMVQKAGADILLHAWAADVLANGKCVTGVKLLTKGGDIPVKAAVTVDATGDGDIAAMAGAEFEKGRPGDGLMQPASIMFTIENVDEKRALLCDSEDQARFVHVPEGIWENVVAAGQASGELPPTVGVIRAYAADMPGRRVINATQVNNVDGTNADDLTRAELQGRKQAYQVLAFLKKHAPGYENSYISNMPAIVGIRETRRILGTAYLTQDDLINGRRWPDAVVKAARFSMDIHNPAGSGQAEGKTAGTQGRSVKVKPYDIPYGCLLPRQIDGLLLAGRCISGCHEALASYRVQCIALATGAAAGTAAAIAVKKSLQPRNVDPAEVQKILGIKA